MYIPFHQLSGEARIWIYQASRSFEHQEKATVLQKVQEFLEQWTSHGNSLRGSGEIYYNQFLILAVEESVQGATGCAVDASIQFIRELEREFQISLLDRTHIAFRRGEDNLVVPLDQLKTTIQEGTILADMMTFDNTITQKGALTDKWLVRAQDSWLGRYFDRP